MLRDTCIVNSQTLASLNPKAAVHFYLLVVALIRRQHIPTNNNLFFGPHPLTP